MKNNVYKIVLGVLFPILFISLFLLFGGTEHGATCWVGFSFVLLSYALMMAVPLVVPNSKSSHLFGATSGTLSSVYFGINLVLGIIFMIADFEQWKFAVGIEVVLLVIFIGLLLTFLISDEETSKKENKQQKEVYAVKTLVSKTKMIADRASDMQIKKLVLKVYDELNSCPSSSNHAVKSIDESIKEGLEKLEGAVVSKDGNEVSSIVSELIIIIKERKELSRY